MTTVLGCMEILYEELGLAVDRQVLVKLFGPRWNRKVVLEFLGEYGYWPVAGQPIPGDIVFVGDHPGIVRESGLVENLHHGRRTFMPLARIQRKLDMVLRCRKP